MLSIQVLPADNRRAVNAFRRFEVPFYDNEANRLLREFIYYELLKVRLGACFSTRVATSLTEAQLEELYRAVPTVACQVVLVYPVLANLRQVLQYAVRAQQQEETPLLPGYERWELHMRFVAIAEGVFGELTPVQP
ncbi:hypothetical protein [Fibrella aquatilis]|uniref:Uncharacterized protein n=1 Tax=Fibrella aquatilis TaxID=2817059 RepID=A0A939JYD1_9BACT|nr:hypothetical protein [Fibrella aquatilis]MBO0933892.1 hypothetical protein [Fibrella aquatilis]